MLKPMDTHNGMKAAIKASIAKKKKAHGDEEKGEPAMSPKKEAAEEKAEG